MNEQLQKEADRIITLSEKYNSNNAGTLNDYAHQY
jgi:hypothetical protein